MESTSGHCVSWHCRRQRRLAIGKKEGPGGSQDTVEMRGSSGRPLLSDFANFLVFPAIEHQSRIASQWAIWKMKAKSLTRRHCMMHAQVLSAVLRSALWTFVEHLTSRPSSKASVNLSTGRDSAQPVRSRSRADQASARSGPCIASPQSHPTNVRSDPV